MTGILYTYRLFLNSIIRIGIVACAAILPAMVSAQKTAPANVTLASPAVKLQWTKTGNGWALKKLMVKKANQWIAIPGVSGEYTLLYSAQQPDTVPVTIYNEKGQPVEFPEQQYRYLHPVWREVMQPVALNTAGNAKHFYPASVQQTTGGELVFQRETDNAQITANWKTDKKYAHDVVVEMKVVAMRDGYFSLATPSLAIIDKNAFSWALIPGHFQGRNIRKDWVRAYAYGQGIPDRPVVTRERTATTLSPLVTANGVTLAVIPEPGTSRDPWLYNSKTHSTWQLGLSLMNRKALLTPTAYHPVLGQKGSFLHKGDSVTFAFRYTIQPADWYTVYKHAAEDIYRLKDFLALKKAQQSLTDRVLSMHRYVINDSTSRWHTQNYNGLEIGAQDYLGGVYGSEKDATKNSDYGAMWMMALMMDDSVLKQTRLPYARNFKLQQQDTQNDFFYGAAAGQYYLTKSKRFTEEWGPYVEPIATTYYMMMDIGNVLLFNPGDTALKKELQRAADKLLLWMNKEGKWAVAYDHATQKELFTDIEDLRPTFYGLLIAYKLLGREKYLLAAKKGADWYIRHATEQGHFTGVCGDARFVPDFATGQSAQALLDLYDITHDKKYLHAAVVTAKQYTTSIYTHPVPSTQEKIVNGIRRQDWEISEVGLSFEHGGSIGSANHRGPILLASHAGMFVRMYAITGDSLFLVMARAAALGRDAFVDTKTSVASYYWDAMNGGAGPYPHHAWWQIGWITDYLLAEAEMRSAGQVKFPRGFITPKVGPHQTYGFATGTIYGNSANLLLKEGLLETGNPFLDYYCAINTQQKKLFLLLLNNDDTQQSTTLRINYGKVINGKTITPVAITAPGKDGGRIQDNNDLAVTIPAYGIRVLEISYR